MSKYKDWIVRYYASHKDIPKGHSDGEMLRELVECKDCAYLRTFYHGEDTPFTYRCDKLCLYTDLSLDDYCSRAKRKEE